MNQRHPRNQWYNGNHHDLVLGEKSICPAIAAEYPYTDDNKGRGSTPPAYQQRGIILQRSARTGRDMIVDVSGEERC